MPDNRSNQRPDSERNDNDAYGSSGRSGRGGSWSNRDDDDMQSRNARSNRPRSAYDSELNARMEQGGSHTSAYGDEYSMSSDRYRDQGDRDISRDNDAGRYRHNQSDGRSARSNSSDQDIDRDDYYGNRSMRDTGSSDRYRGREGGSNQFSSWRNEPSDMRPNSHAGTRSDSGMQRGQHAGRGPKGYRRDDARITEDVNEALTRDAHIDASDIEVQVSGGEVTLSGTVDSRDAKRHAEDIAESISGVSEVNNQIRVSKGANTSSRSDHDSDSSSRNSASNRHSDSDTDRDHRTSAKSGATGGTSTADGAMSAQGSGPSGASNTSTMSNNPSGKPSPNTSGASTQRTGDKGTR